MHSEDENRGKIINRLKLFYKKFYSLIEPARNEALMSISFAAAFFKRNYNHRFYFS